MHPIRRVCVSSALATDVLTTGRPKPTCLTPEGAKKNQSDSSVDSQSDGVTPHTHTHSLKDGQTDGQTDRQTGCLSLEDSY